MNIEDIEALQERNRGQDWLPTPVVAAMLGMKPQTLEKWRCEGKGPPFRRFSRKVVRYERALVQAWIEAR